MTWLRYVRDCGREDYIENALRAKNNYKLYDNKQIKWEGIFMEIKNFRANAVIFIKMNPTDSVGIYPDIAIHIHKYNEKHL